MLRLVLSFLLSYSIALSPLWAELELPACFGDHMVIQRDQSITIDGWAKPSQEIRVNFLELEKKSTANAQGAWQVTFPPAAAGGPYDITISTEDDKKVIQDILLGDVWLCAGQSNMGLSVQNLPRAYQNLPKISDNQLRYFSIKTTTAQEPQLRFPEAQRNNENWSVCSPEKAGGYSAVAYYFAKNIRESINVPIGVIKANKPGSFIEAWIRPQEVQSSKTFEPILKRWEYFRENFTALSEQNDKELALWKKDHEARFKMWKKNPINGPFTPHQPNGPPSLTGSLTPSSHFNAMIAPLYRLRFKGVVWYQGESNSARAYQYRELLPLMITGWREHFSSPELPFILVQLPEFETDSNNYDYQDGGAWEVMRESQLMALKLPNTAMAITLGLGDPYNVHPSRKAEVGERLALGALKVAYGKNIDYCGPIYDHSEYFENKIKVTFNSTGKGLFNPSGQPLVGFKIAGQDQVFHPAQALIVSPNNIEASSDEVKEPLALRYAWDDNPTFSLFNLAGLPASPFRTDRWSVSTQDVQEPLAWMILK